MTRTAPHETGRRACGARPRTGARVAKFVLGAASLAASACAVAAPPSWDAIRASIRADHPDVESISTAELAAWLGGESGIVLIDARRGEEFEVSHIEGARSIPFDASDEELVTRLADVDRDATVVAYCSVGVRSARLSSRLKQAGFSRVRNLDGSIFHWANEGRRVVRDGGEVLEVHPYDDRWGRLLESSLHARRPGSKGAGTDGDPR